MLKKTITYIDYDGKERTEDFYFNLTKSELAEMELTTDGGFKDRMEQVVKAKDQATIIKIFKEVILKAYGEKSADGRKFMKSKEISDGFMATPAYDILFMELATNEQAAADFVNAIIPEMKE